jgi:hypothetical protein
MFSTTIKQSVATLAVVAGLLAAAGPASAQILDGPVLAKAGPQPEAAWFVKAPAKTWTDGNNQPSDHEGYRQGAAFRGELIGLEPTVKGPASPTPEVFTSVSNVAPLATIIWVW